MKQTFLFFIPLLFLLFSIAQKCIKLTNRKTGQESFLYEGTHVGYLQKRKLFMRTGTIQHITDSTIQIGNNQFRRWSLKSIGQRKFGTNVLSILLVGISGFLLPLFSSPENTPEASVNWVPCH